MSVTLAAIGGAAALGSAIYGAVSSSINNNRARRLIQQQRDDNREWYNIRMNQDYTQRSDAQAAFSRQRELLDEQYKRAKASQSVTGATDEALAAQKAAANASVSDTMRDVASQASAYKDNVERQYRAEDAALNQQQAQSYQQQAAQAAQAASQGVNAGLGLMGNAISSGAAVSGGESGNSLATRSTGEASAVPSSSATGVVGKPLSSPVDSDFTPKTLARPTLPKGGFASENNIPKHKV